MDQSARNIAVGITVIVGLAVLGAMILLFTGLPGFLAGGYEVQVRIPSTGGAAEGDFVNLAGMRVGKITDVSFTKGDPSKGVTLTVNIEHKINVPAGTSAVVTEKIIGGAYVELAPPRKIEIDPQTGQPAYLPKDGSAVIQGEIRAESAVSQLQPLMDSLSKLADAIQSLIGEEPAPLPETAPATVPGVETAPAPTEPTGLRATIVKLNQALDDFHIIVGNPKNQQNIEQSLAGLVQATSAATEAMGSVKQFAVVAERTADSASRFIQVSQEQFQELTGKLTADAENISKVVMSLNQITTAIQAAEGTAGKIITDPQLYNNLVDATRQLESLMKEFRKLLDQWRDTGVKVQLR